MNRRGFSSDTPQLDMSKLENRLEMEADHQFKAKRAQELRNSKIVNNLNEEQFSQAITDHFDQYKSLTSKIIGTKLNKQSGERKTIEIDQRQNGKILLFDKCSTVHLNSIRSTKTKIVSKSLR